MLILIYLNIINLGVAITIAKKKIASFKNEAIFIYFDQFDMVREEGLEPSHQRHKCLKLACLPISPLAQF